MANSNTLRTASTSPTKFIHADCAPIGGYDASNLNGTRRRPGPSTIYAEDHYANQRRRTILSANARDLARNWTIASWAVRKHLAYICDLSFQAKTADRGFNTYLEQWWENQCQPWNFDVAGRHSWRRAVRLAEACRCLDGDIGWLKLVGASNRGKIQAIEADRIAMPGGSVPKNQKADEWINGVRVDLDTGRALAYGICRRVGSQKEFIRTIPASSLFLHAAYEFRYDQIRGISPIASALNSFRDCHEAIDFALAKVKLGQLFGLAVKTEVSDAGPFAGPATYTVDSDGDGEADSAPRIDLQNGGPFLTELYPGEDINVIESKTPSSETVAFIKMMMQITLQSLDIPYSMYSEEFANYAGQRGAVQQYLYACDDKIRDLQMFLTQHARWKMGLAVEDGTLELPSGKDFGFINYEMVPGAVPFDQPQREARGTAMEISMGLNSPYRAARERGTTFEKMIDEISEGLKYAKERGVNLYFGDSTAFAPEISVQGDTNGQ